ncbi:MAG: CRISPR system precrRNA processing endoribonuclease RAMP protein Cas6 [Chloroflexi bacterium]|nr:CRISPR system precrRNA processing endoribonuclease RAMP protein Cas6 [Chloroflexota bacterium]MBU1749956.1 CRISPR system precrRNA processing endoribonuclease RAMP protein Cas6 [Chloroflexota bacterium]
MLTSLVFTLTADRPRTLPSHLGRASHAAFLRLLAQQDSALAERLHTPDERRPFTCSNLWGARRRGGSLTLTPDAPVYLRYTGLTAAVSEHLQRLADAPPASIEVENVPLTVQQATLDPAAHPWAGQTTYARLAADHLLPGTPPAPHAALEFASPTAFRSGGLTVPVPLPGLVYGSLVDKWNAFAPVAVSEEVRRFADECLAISRYKLATSAVSGKGEALQIGCVGHCRYAAVNRDRYWLGVIQLLTDYAFYAGVGYQTTMGLGQAQRARPRGDQDETSGE